MSLKRTERGHPPNIRPAKVPGKALGPIMDVISACRIGFGESIATSIARDRTHIEARFWSKVNKTDGCWLWTGGLTGSGSVRHGQFTLPRNANPQRHIKTHRLSWTLAYGTIPNGLSVLHKCDVPTCVRPDHLFLGTQDDNMKDAARKGRLYRPRTRTLTQADRLAIYHMPDRRGLGVELALRYRVKAAAISKIRHGQFVGSPLDRAFQRVPHVNLRVSGEVR